ncbi:MAG TPA: Uma2 family endonuclease [Thermoanaerobaculia bacterium]
MPAPAHRIRYTYDEYLALEATSNVRHEFLDGQIYAMAGGTPEHAALSAAVIGVLFLQLRGTGCRAYDADLRVRTPSGLATYPDVTLVCGPTDRDPEDPNAVTNPTVTIEVLSRSTEEYDRGDKLEHYKSIRSLRQVLLMSHRERRIEVWTREENDVWSRAVARDGDVVTLTAGLRLDVREVYEAAAEPPR